MSDVIYMTTIRELHSQLEEVTRQRDEALARSKSLMDVARYVFNYWQDFGEVSTASMYDLEKALNAKTTD